MTAAVRHVRTDLLDIAYEQTGDGYPVVLLHGFPYDPRGYDDVVAALAGDGLRLIVPYLRGYGPTRFLSDATLRSGEQAALGHDLLQLLDALEIEDAVLAGYDWGGRAACVVAALWPERVRGLLSCTGYNIQDIAGSSRPAPAAAEHRYWYQYYFHTERGRAGLTENRRDVCRLLWQLWSPHWDFDDATFGASAASFDNPDFVDVVIHSYRNRYGYVDGDPAFAAIEAKLAAQPAITVPTINLHGDGDGVAPAALSAKAARHFTGPYERRVIPIAGHNIPQETPEPFAQALRDLCRGSAYKESRARIRDVESRARKKLHERRDDS